MLPKVNLARNTAFSFIANASNILLMVLLLMAGRYLGDVDYGRLTFALAYTTIFGWLSNFGLEELTKRTLAREPELSKRLLGNVVVWKVILGVLAYGAAVLLIQVMKPESPAVRSIVYILGIAAALKSFKTIFLVMFQAFERFELAAISQTIHNVLALTAGAWVLVTTRDIFGFVIVFTLVKLVDVIITYLLIHRNITRLVPQFDFRFMKDFQIQAMPFGLFFVTILIYSYIDTIMLSAWRSDAEVGWYNAAYRIYEGIMTIPTILCQALSPHLSRLFVHSREAHLDLAERAMKYIFIISLPILVCGYIYSDDIILLLFGSEFENAIPAFRILLVGTAFVFANWVFNTIFISIDRQKLLMYASMIGLGINIIVNIFLIPRFGFIGAAISTLVGETVIFVASYILTWRAYTRISMIRYFIRPFLAVFILGGTLVQVNIAFTPFGVGFCIVVYSLFLLAFEGFDENELAYARRLLDRRKKQRITRESDESSE